VNRQPILVGLMLAFLSACAPSPEQQRLQEETLLTIQAEDAVKQLLRDPASATFTGEHVVRHDGRALVCGYVNARNGFGGMAGPQRFIGGPNNAQLESQMTARDMNALWTLAGC
jgi:hypothetical protein